MHSLVDNKQNGGWFATTRCHAIKSHVTVESCVTMNQWVLILWWIRKIARPDRLATRPKCWLFWFEFVDSTYCYNAKSLAWCLPIFISFSAFLMPSGMPKVSIQYIPRNIHMVFALLCFVVVIHWLIFPYPSGLLHWHCGNLTIATVPAKQPWWIWINTSREFIMNDCITTTKQSTTKPCAYFLGYTVADNMGCPFRLQYHRNRLLNTVKVDCFGAQTHPCWYSTKQHTFDHNHLGLGFEF